MNRILLSDRLNKLPSEIDTMTKYDLISCAVIFEALTRAEKYKQNKEAARSAARARRGR